MDMHKWFGYISGSNENSSKVQRHKQHGDTWISLPLIPPERLASVPLQHNHLATYLLN